MTAVESVLSVFTALIDWFVTSIGAVVPIFYVAETGLTFIGGITVIGVAIAVATLIFATIRSMLRLH